MLQDFRLFFPINVTLFYKARGKEIAEPYFKTGICHYYIQMLNRAIYALPMTNTNHGGLIRDFACDDALVSQYVREKIRQALPQIMYFYDWKLHGVVTYTFDSESPLPVSVEGALKEDLLRQLAEGWGRNEIEITINDGIFYFQDGSNHLDRKWNIGMKVQKIRGGTLNVRVPENDLYVDTREELRHRLGDV